MSEMTQKMGCSDNGGLQLRVIVYDSLFSNKYVSTSHFMLDTILGYTHYEIPKNLNTKDCAIQHHSVSAVQSSIRESVRQTGLWALLCYSFHEQVIPISTQLSDVHTGPHELQISFSSTLCRFYCFFDDLEDSGSFSAPELSI